MLRSIRQSYGNKLGAMDGAVGHVEDFYFDDQNWAVRYVVADTGSWLPGRQVLLSPQAFNGFQFEEKVLTVNLTRQQIEDSPARDTHTPLSRQYELEYYRHYGWPNYWDGGGLWGLNSFPTMERPAAKSPGGPAVAHDAPLVRADAHLRSTQAVNGYQIQAADGIVGHVCDFLVEPRTWAIEQLVIKTGHRLSGLEVLIPVGLVERISYDDSTVFVRLTRAAIEESPAFDLERPDTDKVPEQAPPHRGLTL